MRKYIGFSILSLFTLVLFISSTINGFMVNPFLVLPIFVLGVFAVYTILVELRRTSSYPTTYRLFSRASGYDFIATFIGSILTYYLSVNLGIGAVLASSIIGMLAVIFIKPYAVAVFCGSFVGMSSPELMDPAIFLLASIAVSIIFVFAKDVFNGYGGKLGTMALSSALIVSFISGANFLDAPVYDNLEMFLIVIFSIIGALLTYILNIRFKEGPVMASGFIGLMAGAFLPLIFNETGQMLAVVTFGASFVGMSAHKKMPEETLMIFSGLLFGLIFIVSAPYFGGAGGKLGATAFTSVLSVYGIRHWLKTYIVPSKN